MTAQEKAKQLLWEYLPFLEGWTDEGKTQLAKRCALIAVDEVMQESSVLPYGMEYLSRIDYWEGVKQEIEKL